MNTKNILYINFGLTILTLIGLICIIIYIIINNNNNNNKENYTFTNTNKKDNFADEQYNIPDIRFNPTYSNMVITDKDGNMDIYSLKNFADTTKQAINDSNQDIINSKTKQLSTRYDTLMEKLNTLETDGFKYDSDLVTLRVDNTADGEWLNTWIHHGNRQPPDSLPNSMSLKGGGTEVEMYRRPDNDKLVGIFKFQKP